MKKVVYSFFGPFGLSKKAIDYMIKKGSDLAVKELESAKRSLNINEVSFSKLFVKNYLNKCPYGNFFIDTKDRYNPFLIEVVEKLGRKASYVGYGNWQDGCDLRIEEIPDDSYCRIVYNVNFGSEIVTIVKKRKLKNKTRLTN